MSPPFSSALQCHSQLTALQPVDPQQAIRGDPAPRPACQKAAPSEGPQTFRHTLEALAGPRTGRPAAGSTQNIAFFFFFCQLLPGQGCGRQNLRPCAPAPRENARVPVSAWGSMPAARGPSHQSASFCPPKVHAASLSSTLEPKLNSRVLGENKPCQHPPQPPAFLPSPLPSPPQAPSSPDHEIKPTLLAHGRALYGSPDPPRPCPVHPVSSPSP